jgi:tyrosine-protein kinase Etk/Wzc
LSEEAKINLQQSAAAKSKRLELLQKKMELQTRFTNEHPIVVGINAQLKEMDSEIASISGHIKELPRMEQELLGLNRDIKVNTDLYTALLNTAQQLRLITAGKVSNVRLVDAAMMPEKPVKPASVTVLLSMFLGLFLGLMSAFIRKSLSGTIDEPDQIEKMFGVPVYATIPHSKCLKKLYASTNSKSTKLPLLANVSSVDTAIESLRSFCNALQFSMTHAKNNVVMMTGATPGVGKSFVSVNLAAITATAGKRVLLVDADLRNGHLHKYFDVARQDGLSEYMAGNIPVEKVIHRGVMPSMDFISTGNLPTNPSELLLRPRFGELITSLSANYDLILVDSTPILAVSDALTTGAHAGAIFLMTRAGVTTAEEVRESIIRLRQSGLSAKGLLLNDMEMRPGRYGYGYPYGMLEEASIPAKELKLIDASARVR